MVRFVILILIKLVSKVISAYSPDMVYVKLADLEGKKYNQIITLDKPFTFMIQSEKSLINHTLSCYANDHPHWTFVNEVHFIEKPNRMFASKKYFEATPAMQTYWECKLKCTLSNTTIKFRFDVQVVGTYSTSQPMLPAGSYQKGNAYDYSPTSKDQGYNYGQQNNKIVKDTEKEQNYNIRHDAATGNKKHRKAMQTEPLPNQLTAGSYQRGNAYNYSPTSKDQGSNYGQQNNKIVKDTEKVQTSTMWHDAGTGNEIYRQTMQTEPQPNQEQKDTNINYTLIIAIISVIALLQSFLIAVYFVRKRLCGRKQSVYESGRQEGSSEPQYEELNYETTIVNRPPCPLPPQDKENIKYMHYNSPYDHRIIRTPNRQCRTGANYPAL